MLARCADGSIGDVEPLLTLLRRYAAEAAREEARLFCDELVAEFEALIAREGADRIGGFIAEPIQGVGGFTIPPDGMFGALQSVLREYDIPFISDEVQTALEEERSVVALETTLVAHGFPSPDFS